jgi:hypothetical protein
MLLALVHVLFAIAEHEAMHAVSAQSQAAQQGMVVPAHAFR